MGPPERFLFPASGLGAKPRGGRPAGLLGLEGVRHPSGWAVACSPPSARRRRQERQDRHPVFRGVRAASPRPAGGSSPLGRLRTRDAPQSSHCVAEAGAQNTKRVAGRARWARGRAHTLLRARAPPASPAEQPGYPESTLPVPLPLVPGPERP